MEAKVHERPRAFGSTILFAIRIRRSFAEADVRRRQIVVSSFFRKYLIRFFFNFYIGIIIELSINVTRLMSSVTELIIKAI